MLYFGPLVYAVLCVKLLLKFSRCVTGVLPRSVFAWNPVPRRSRVPDVRRPWLMRAHLSIGNILEHYLFKLLKCVCFSLPFSCQETLCVSGSDRDFGK